jgi:hypothetical protein
MIFGRDLSLGIEVRCFDGFFGLCLTAIRRLGKKISFFSQN